MPRKLPTSLTDDLLAVRLEIEQAKLAKLRGEYSADGSHVETFLHYEDLPPPSPEDQDRFYVRLRAQMEALETAEDKTLSGQTQAAQTPAAQRYDVNPMTHNPHTGEPYDYSEVEAKYGPYERPDKPSITVTLRPSAKDAP